MTARTVPADITGTITLVSPNVTRANAFRIYVAALESSGYPVAQDGDVYRVVALNSRPQRARRCAERLRRLRRIWRLF